MDLYNSFIEATGILYIKFFTGPFFFFDLWSVNHIWSGFMLFLLFSALRIKRPLYVVLLCLILYEVFEITLTYLAWDLFFPESIKDQFTDIIIGFSGSFIGMLFISNYEKLREKFPSVIESLLKLFVSLTFTFLWIVFSFSSICRDCSFSVIRNLSIFSLWLAQGYLTVQLFEKNRLKGNISPWVTYFVTLILALIANYLIVNYSYDNAKILIRDFPAWLFSIRVKLILVPILPLLFRTAHISFRLLITRSVAAFKPVSFIVLQHKYLFLLVDTLIILAILASISFFQDLADKILIVFWFIVSIYTISFKRYNSFIRLIISTLIAFSWVYAARNNYGYNYSYLTVGGINLLPVMSWALGMMGIFELLNYFDFKSNRVKFLNYALVFWIMLLIIETYAYHVINIRDISSGSSSGLPLCDCIHAPWWMRVAYFSMGPLYYLIIIAADRSLNKFFQPPVHGGN